MCAAANFNSNASDLAGTFAMTNICPQIRELNAGPWRQFEQWVRQSLLQSDCSQSESPRKRTGRGKKWDEVVVVTGPAFLPFQVGGEILFLYRTIGACLLYCTQVLTTDTPLTTDLLCFRLCLSSVLQVCANLSMTDC